MYAVNPRTSHSLCSCHAFKSVAFLVVLKSFSNNPTQDLESSTRSRGPFHCKRTAPLHPYRDVPHLDSRSNCDSHTREALTGSHHSQITPCHVLTFHPHYQYSDPPGNLSNPFNCGANPREAQNECASHEYRRTNLMQIAVGPCTQPAYRFHANSSIACARSPHT